MANTSALLNSTALILLQNLKEGMDTERISDVQAAKAEVDAAIAEFKRARLPEEPIHTNDLCAKMLLEIGGLHEKVAQCEGRLAEFQRQAQTIKADTTQIVARAEVCNLLVEQQQKENAGVLTAMEYSKANAPFVPPPCVLASSPNVRSAPSMSAIVSFPGGPRTITIHPPGSSGYRPVVRDEQGNVILDFRRTKPLCREGAFIAPLEDVDWFETTRVCGRGPGVPTAQPYPRWPSGPTSYPPLPRSPSDISARRRELPTSVDLFGRSTDPERVKKGDWPLLPTGTASSSPQVSSPDMQFALGATKPETISPTSSVPPSPTLARGQKRARNDEDDDSDGDASLTMKTREEVSAQVDLGNVKEPVTPMPVRCGESQVPEGPSRKKHRTSAPLKRTQALLDITRGF